MRFKRKDYKSGDCLKILQEMEPQKLDMSLSGTGKVSGRYWKGVCEYPTFSGDWARTSVGVFQGVRATVTSFENLLEDISD
uniref:Uncharacterized protein n=1 Tax=Sphaerodactylus townsendi TaxID=933632 RepID=A0ACB8FUL3_9SAUR